MLPVSNWDRALPVLYHRQAKHSALCKAVCLSENGSYMTCLLGALGEGGAPALTKPSPSSTYLHRVPLGTAAAQGSWKPALPPSLHLMVRAYLPDVAFV